MCPLFRGSTVVILCVKMTSETRTASLQGTTKHVLFIIIATSKQNNNNK